MMQALLEDRFGLRLHKETITVPAFVLTVLAMGPKLRPTKEGACVAYDRKVLHTNRGAERSLPLSVEKYARAQTVVSTF